MRIVVFSIPEEGLRQELDLPIALEGDTEKNNAHVSIKVHKHGNRVLVEGRADMSASLLCSRCLNEFSYPLGVSFKEEFIPAPELSEEPEHELTSEELNISFYSNDEIDISGLVREQLLLCIPIKPLCNPDCCGICSKCGKDLNEGLCDCKEEEIDPRLLSLKRIKKSLNYRKE